jgi:hypothetical protein
LCSFCTFHFALFIQSVAPPISLRWWSGEVGRREEMQSEKCKVENGGRGRSPGLPFGTLHFELFTFWLRLDPSGATERLGHGGLGAPRFDRLTVLNRPRPGGE